MFAEVVGLVCGDEAPTLFVSVGFAVRSGACFSVLADSSPTLGSRASVFSCFSKSTWHGFYPTCFFIGSSLHAFFSFISRTPFLTVVWKMFGMTSFGRFKLL